jgi:Ner family transcriptional regulator
MAGQGDTTDWPWRSVLDALQRTGTSVLEIALRHGLDPSSFYKLKDNPLPRPAAILAEEMGLAPQAIWPSRYAGDGRPLSRREWLTRARTAETLRRG